MALQPNLSGVGRFGYAVVGLVLIGWGFFYADPGFWRYAWPILGAFILIAGLIGFCPILAILGIGGKRS